MNKIDIEEFEKETTERKFEILQNRLEYCYKLTSDIEKMLDEISPEHPVWLIMSKIIEDNA
jgi:hypothetical protein